MTAAIDMGLIERARATFREKDLAPASSSTRPSRVPSVLSCVYDPGADAFRIIYEDLSGADVRPEELADAEGKRVAACSVDEFRRGVEVVFQDGTVTSFSAEYPRYLRDKAYRKSVDARRGVGGEDIGRRVAMRVKQLRQRKGWSVAELARRCNMAAPNVHRVESGAHVPSTKTLVRLAGAFRIPLATLVKV